MRWYWRLVVTAVECVNEFFVCIFFYNSKFADLSGSGGHNVDPFADQGVATVGRGLPLLPVLGTGPASTGWKVRMLLTFLVRLLV